MRMPPPDSTTSRTVGGRYRLDRSIGSGGMGTVWHGTDELLGREVAVKEVRFPAEIGEKEQAELRERTLREARATARLSHPNVVTTYDVVEHDGRPYIVMELVDARSLSTLLREDGPLPPHRVAQIGLEMLSALETSHRQGVVHRDVKPGNVLITPEGRAVLTDFGIATVAGDPAMTSTGVVLGSPAYMSPERARGHRPGPEADLWSLGATLFAALEGRPPYDAENALGTLTSVISDPVPTPSVGGPLGQAITGLLGKDPATRMDIPAARALLTRAAADRTAAVAAPATTVALDRGAHTEAVRPVSGPPPTTDRRPDETAYEETRRRPGGLLVAALIVGLLLVGGLAALAVARNQDGTTATPQTPSETAQPSSDTPSPTESTTPPETTPATPADGAPAGYQTYTDETGFSVAVPAGWTAQRSSDTAVDLTDPSGSRFLRIDQTDEPGEDAKKRWQEVEKDFQDEVENYQRISIESVDYRGWEAADWEFTFGSNTHVLNRGFVPNENKGYALYMSSPEEQWAESRQIFDVAAATFSPAGG